MTAASMAAHAPGLDESAPHKRWTLMLASLGMFIVALVRSKAGRSAGRSVGRSCPVRGEQPARCLRAPGRGLHTFGRAHD
jgi:hypothetical protein